MTAVRDWSEQNTSLAIYYMSEKSHGDHKIHNSEYSLYTNVPTPLPPESDLPIRMVLVDRRDGGGRLSRMEQSPPDSHP